MIKNLFKYLLFIILALVVITLCLLMYFYWSADMRQPDLIVDRDNYMVADSGSYKSCNGNYLRQNEQGLWEAYLHGSPIDRGVAMGALSKDLLHYQEEVFMDQIRVFVPSDNYLKFLRFFTVMFNRNLGEHIEREYREEIYGISLSCTNEYNMIGNPYERQLNYHAAHDIGHTMQEYMLVGCSAFAVWGDKSADSSLMVGRNFDFYVGDDFARNKLVMFVDPDQGYRFVSVGWTGMIGVLSGMNEAGLTVTINAAKGTPPTSAAVPISILAREILQYASTIDEAYAIAQKRQTFVSESLLIASVKDGRAAIIEKTPTQMTLFNAKSNQIISTNHYQSDSFAADEHNVENIENSDSPYRHQRLEQLLGSKNALSPNDAAEILRDRQGIKGDDIGLANEKSINQSIAHHSVIFKPEQGLMWVSTAPWQSGEYICYDVKRIFKSGKIVGEITTRELTIAADSVFLKIDYPKLLSYRSLLKRINQAIEDKTALPTDSILKFRRSNPNMYHVYELLGNYYQTVAGDNKQAVQMWQEALKKEIPTLGTRRKIEEKLKKLENE